MRTIYLMAGLAIVFWGTNPAVSKLSLSGMTGVELVCYASGIAAVVLAAWGVATGKWREALEYTARDYVELAAIGLGPNLGCYLLTYWSLTLLPAHIATIINYMWPILTVVFSALILKERVTAATMLALFLAFAGVALTTAALGGGASLSGDQLLGVVLIASASVLYALFNVLNKRHGGSQLVNMAVYFGVSSLATLPFVLAQGPTPLGPVELGGVLWVGILVNAAGYVLWCTALQAAPSALLANMAYVAPVVSLVVSSLLLGEHIALESCAGLALIIVGFLLQAWLTWRRGKGV